MCSLNSAYSQHLHNCTRELAAHTRKTSIVPSVPGHGSTLHGTYQALPGDISWELGLVVWFITRLSSYPHYSIEYTSKLFCPPILLVTIHAFLYFLWIIEKTISYNTSIYSGRTQSLFSSSQNIVPCTKCFAQFLRHGLAQAALMQKIQLNSSSSY